MAQLAGETKVANAAYLEAASREALARGAERRGRRRSAGGRRERIVELEAEAEQNAASLEAAPKAEAKGGC